MMKKMKLEVMILGVAIAQEAPADENNPLNAVVKLEVSTAKPDIFCPWANRTGASSGSGVVIAPGRILTCAHCVTDACYIRVRKHNEDTLYHGAVEFIDNDADLALVKVKDSAFMNGVMPMEIGDTPRVQDDVLAVGYPVGGEDISYTRGSSRALRTWTTHTARRGCSAFKWMRP